MQKVELACNRLCTALVMAAPVWIAYKLVLFAIS